MFRILKTWLGVVAVLFLLTELAVAAPIYFVYVSDQRVITVESVSSSTLILNVINLGQDVWVIRPYDIMLRSGSASAIGQAFRKEEKGPVSFYATHLVKPHEFVGVAVVGELVRDPDGAVVRVGSRFFFLQKIGKSDFGILERQISNIDLQRENSEAALREAGIRQGFGDLVSYPDGETEALNALFPEPGQALGPRVISKKDAKPVVGTPPGSEIEVQGLISKSGELLDAKVTRGISTEADQRALATVRNSWKFVPAVRDGEVVEATVRLRVKFSE